MEITVQTFSVKKSAVERYGPVQTKKTPAGNRRHSWLSSERKKTSMLPYSMCVFFVYFSLIFTTGSVVGS